MAHPLTLFRFSEGLRFASGIGTLGGLCALGYAGYTYAYYKYLITKRTKESSASNTLTQMAPPTPISSLG